MSNTSLKEYDAGINDDLYAVWRNDDDIGYIQLAFKVVTEAMYDLILGDYSDMMSAHYFFFGNEEESLYSLWAKVLGFDDQKLPDIVIKHRNGHVPEEDVEKLRNMCTTIKTI